MARAINFVDLFAGIGGIRLGFETAFKKAGYSTNCVLTSEIKPHAINVLNQNFDHHNFVGDIFKLKSEDIPDFDFLLAGFPCQPFSSGGKRLGFIDTRGTLFFEIERILRAKNPYGFILENVEGIVKHDLISKSDKIGRTLQIILYKLETELNYKVSWEVLDSKDFGLPQSRKRVFIVGTKDERIKLQFPKTYSKLYKVLESGKPNLNSEFTNKLLLHYTIKELYGKSIKDKRGGKNNIHSWDIGLKGEVSKEQNELLNLLFKERRKKRWSAEIGIDWMDGIPLTIEQIRSFYDHQELDQMLIDLTEKGYVKFEHPKKLVKEEIDGRLKKFRTPDKNLPKGYNIVTGKLSFEINKILNPKSIAPTLVATDVQRIAVPDNDGIRRLTIREGLRLFGYPDKFQMDVKEAEAFDLLGNTVAVPVIAAIAEKLCSAFKKNIKDIPIEANEEYYL